MDLLDSSIKLLQEFEPLALQADQRGYCVCSSFGKDSIAMLKVFEIANVKFWIKWNITGIDPPELVYFAREQCKIWEEKGIKVKEQKYDKSMFLMIIDHKVPPSRIFRYCCDELKEKRCIESSACFHSFGVRKAESNSRQGRNELEVIHKNKDKRLSLSSDIQMQYHQMSLYLSNDNTDNRKQFENCTVKGVRAVNPIIYWSDKYLWDFIKSENVPYCNLYDEGFKRLGCIGCPMANKGRIKEFKRYPKFYNYYLKAFEKMLIKRKQDKVDERRILEGKKPMPWTDAQSVMDWWLQLDIDENQLTLDDYY